MILHVLVDNNTYIDRYYGGEPALSFYIEDEGARILFDTGYSDLFLKNAEALGINLFQIDTLVFSHGHNDHTRGLKYYCGNLKDRSINIVAHPHTFLQKIYDAEEIGSPISKDQLEKQFNLILTKAPVKVSSNITYLGEIPRKLSFEVRKTIGQCRIDGILKDDELSDDSALVYHAEEGLYIITGCSHSGICNIIEYARQVCHEERVCGIIGGFHLFDVNDQVKKTVEYLNNNKISQLYPSHCTSFEVKAEIHKTIPIKEVGVGLKLEW